ncbi:putative Peroxisomal N(1)-acetyl-spermine/spermidine oxidase [Hypsibius exemplaris]|uniref:Peroxisomal N(1)-acetyl-spermine/spermidine oxidase n=1 Tax=Hypsibius exemplaris TaxID=2072580 RepID=A0A1W0XDD7_HYPEX|nr:putative Peroxisomal N(1)-acetyl-spermine/spermidine oxidase [Hypsibius exemplaris]
MSHITTATSTWILLLILSVPLCAIESQQNLKDQNVPIIIIGAGAAGLAAAQRLYDAGFRSVTILEAEPRTGGRIFTSQTSESDFVELGAQFVHGQDTVLHDFAHDHGLLTLPAPTEAEGWVVQNFNLTAADRASMDKEKAIFRSVTNSLERPSNHSNTQSVESLRAPLFSDASPIGQARRWSEETYDQCVRNEMIWTASPDPRLTSPRSYSDFKQVGGNFILKPSVSMHDVLSAMTATFPREWIIFNRTVSSIDLISNTSGKSLGIAVTTPALHGTGIRIYRAAHVIVTVSLGVLKSQPSLFDPPLSSRKTKAISKAGFGSATKLFFKFDTPFWEKLEPKNASGFGLIYRKPFLLTPKDSPNASSINGREWYRYAVRFGPETNANNTIFLRVGGDGARQVDALSDRQVIDDIWPILQQFAGAVHVPRPLNLIREKWTANGNFLGTYSYFSLESALANLTVADLASPEWEFTRARPQGNVAHRLLFAGEATHSEYFSTVHGAILSGQREADRITSYYSSNGQVTTAASAPLGNHATRRSTALSVALLVTYVATLCI